MNLVIYTEAQDKTASAVVSMTDTTPLTELEQLVLGDTPTISVTFTDGSAAPAWAGQAGYTMSLALGTPDGDGRLDYTQIQAETAITGGWEGNLPLDTPALVTALNLLVNQGATILRPPTQRYTYQAPRFAWFVLQIAVRGPDGYLTTYASLRVCVLNRVITSNFTEQQSPDAEVFAWTEAQLALKANIASPTFTGIPAAPTAAADTDTTQIATTAFVLGQASDATPLIDGTAAAGTSEKYARGNHVHPTDTSRAPLASPTFTGTPAAPTAAVDTSTTQLATTAYVTGQGYLKSATAATTYQPLNAELTAISGLAANGIVTRTSSSTAAARTITGTAGQVTVTNGDGISGNPTLSLPTALTSVDSVTASAATNLTLTGGSSGTSLTLGQGGSGAATFNRGLTATKYTYPDDGNAVLMMGRYSVGLPTAFYQTPSNGTNYGWLNAAGSDLMRLSGTNGNLLIGGTTDISGTGGLKVFGTTAATSTTTGSLQTAGGLGVAGAIYAGGNIVASSSVFSFSGTTIGAGTANWIGSDSVGGLFVNAANGTTAALGVNNVNSLVASSTRINIPLTTASTSTTTGALQVAGGVGVAGNIYAGGTISTNSGTTTPLDLRATGANASIGLNADQAFYLTSQTSDPATVGVQTKNSVLLALRGSYWNGSSATLADATIQHVVSATTPTTRLAFKITNTEHFSISNAGSVLAISPTGGLGYGTGAGGTVTQITSRTTGVTLNKISGAITLFTAAGSATWQSFTVTNSAVAATDVVLLSQKSGTDLYMLEVTAVGAGSFRISFATTGGTTSEAPVFNFAVIKAVAA